MLTRTKTIRIWRFASATVPRTVPPFPLFTGSECLPSTAIVGNNIGFPGIRNYSQQNPRPGFFGQFVENIKQELNKNKEMKESLKKFREEADKLEQSDALKRARAKYNTVESEASVIAGKLSKVKESLSEVIEEAGKTELAKKAGQITEEIGKTARGAAETISEKGQKLGAAETFKTISSATAAVREELESKSIEGRVYVAPVNLRKRQETEQGEARVFTADDVTMDVELHKDSKFFQSWEKFKNNNQYVNKILDWKIKYEESDNPVVRASRLLTDKMTDIVGGLFQKTELSETLTEILKMDPTFEKTKFLQQCETDIIPNILEAMIRGDLEILRDWCHEGPYNIISVPIQQALAQGYTFHSKVLDIESVDLAMGKMMDQGPVLILTFTAQQIMCLKDRNGNNVEGDPEKVLRVNYVWALSRDATILDPKAAWRLLDISASSSEQFL